MPSSVSSQSKDSEGVDDSTIDGDESEEFSGALILVMWSNLLLLLAKCQKPGCGAGVLSDNMKIIRNGIKQDFIKLYSYTVNQGLQLKLFQLAMMVMKRSGQALSL